MVESAFIDARAREKLLRSKNQRVERNFKSANFETYLTSKWGHRQVDNG